MEEESVPYPNVTRPDMCSIRAAADDDPGRPVIEIAIYPEVVWLAARSLREHSTGRRSAS
jgi:hypothetical protein